MLKGNNMKHLSHLIPALENVSLEFLELKREITDAIGLAKSECRTVHITWAGLFDLLVYPSGNFQTVPLSSFKLYKISDESGNHCEEVRL